ncbi:transposase [Dyadobacter bucti]|uniref:transposase n=1 Tax=Dyadobacter bucti TaxID=2572203 RepID=UPI003F70341A
MENKENYVRRTQKDYTLSFKLSVVNEVELGLLTLTQVSLKYGIQGDHTVKKWLQKYGKFDWENQSPNHMPKSQEQRILELEAKVKLLEKQKAQLERQHHIADSKAVIFDMMIELAEQEYQIDIRKNLPPGQSKPSQKTGKKA